jgi:hypothetical protein
MPCSHVAGFCVMIGRACKSALHGTDYPISTFCLQIYFQQKKILFHLYFLLYPVYVNIFIESYDNQARSSLYANTQLRAHRRAENKNKEQKKKKKKEK